MRADLEWQVALGADEAILDGPVNRYETPKAPAKPAVESAPAGVLTADDGIDTVAAAKAAVVGIETLAELKQALAAYEHCELKRGAKSLVFSDGHVGARVMIVGEAPGRDEDVAGRPFVGRAGLLLDQMFAAIGLARTHEDPKSGLYITNVLPWRPPQNRDPAPAEMEMMLPFLRKHIELAAPDVIVAMGNHACAALLGRRGITRLRGTWAEALDRPCLPMFHPAFLLRTPIAKRDAWADLLSLKAKLA